MNRFRTLLPAVTKLLLAAVIVYFAATTITLEPAELVSYFRHAGFLFYVSLLLFTVFLLLQAFIWTAILNDSSRQLSFRDGLLVYINSQFAKYIPGGFWNYAGRVVLASRKGVPFDIQMSTIVYENVLLVLAASMYALILLADLGEIPLYSLALLALLLTLLYLFFNPVSAAVNRCLQLLMRRLGTHRFTERFAARFAESLDRPLFTLQRNRFFLYFGYFMVSHFIMGISFWLLLKSFHIQHVGIFYAAGTFASAWLLGLLSPLPGGLGVREGLLVYLLSFQTDTAAALHLSVIARIWNMAGELLFWAMMNAVHYITKKRMRAHDAK
ncbi:lysylphosphatidylglycerol synthase domain-containing protein [Paenibacillus solisilvae]|uniref:Phosphatidylglycerol lysyltransferase n=1 Tax=Paenibacillus solisilvae TaxID=2486751 RepID=A0ABW0W306_9BACL